MSTFTYNPTESVTIAPNGDISVTDGATTTTYAKGGATKTVTKIPPDPNPPPPEAPVSNKPKPNGDVVHTYTDLTQTPPVTTKITFHPNGDVEIVVSKGQDRTKTDVNNGTGVRSTRAWTEPAKEPTTWDKTETPTSTTGAPGPSAPAAPSGGSTAPVSSPTGGKKPKKKKGRRGKASKRVGKGPRSRKKKARRR
jgi:hypothetical protein